MHDSSPAAPAGRAQLTLPAAVFISWLAAAALNWGLLVARGPLRPGERLLLHAFDTAHFFGLASLSVLAVAALGAVPIRSRLGRFAVVLGCAMALGWLTLLRDLENFANRHAQVLSPLWTLLLGIALISAAVPLAAWLAQSFALWGLRWVPLAGAAGLWLANGLALVGDYEGIHLYVSLCCVAAAARALQGAPWPQHLPGHALFTLPKRAKALTLLACFTLGVLSLAASPPPQVRKAWHQTSSSPTPSFVARFQAYWADPSSSAAGLQRAVGDADPWLMDRSQRAPIPPSSNRLIHGAPVVIYLTIDALRADVVNTGAHDQDLPTLAWLRDHSTTFTNARAPSTQTKSSVASVFMGTYFSQQFWTPIPEGGAHAPGRTRP